MVVPVFRNPGSLSPFFSSMLFRRHRSKSNPPLVGRSMEPVIVPAPAKAPPHIKVTANRVRHGKEWGEIQIQIAWRVPRRAQQEGKGGGGGEGTWWMDGCSSQLR